MNSKDQVFLFVLITLIGMGVVATAITMPPSRFDPVGTQNIMGVIGALVTIFSAICAYLAYSRVRQTGGKETGKSLDSVKTGAMFIIGPAVLSALIVNRTIPTELALVGIYFLVGVLVIWVLPSLSFSRKTLGFLGVSGVLLTVGVTQLFQQVLGLPLP